MTLIKRYKKINDINNLENMSNFIERHPMYTLFATSVAITTLAWTVLTYVLDKNIDVHKALIDTLRTENSNYIARINHLESENKKLKKLNDYYLDWITKSSYPLPALKVELQHLAEENIRLKEQQENQINVFKQDTMHIKVTDDKKYVVKERIPKSEAYRDDITEIIIGVSHIDVNSVATLQITFPDNSIKKDDKILAGQTYRFRSNNRDYILIISKIDFVYNYIEIEIVEK
jgi:CRISPR/Cas system-associated endoribonuclease Cas2